jgi:hypothetical protein
MYKNYGINSSGHQLTLNIKMCYFYILLSITNENNIKGYGWFGKNIK